jgi:hypothetical protein
MGKAKRVEISCDHCGATAIKTTSAVNYAIKCGKSLYCTYGCSNKARTKDAVLCCKWCEIEFHPKYKRWRAFCCARCAGLYSGHQKYLIYIVRWKKGLENGCTGCNGFTVSGHIRRYLFERYDKKCCECGWSKKHSITGKIPLEVDHIDGNWKNNKEANLRLVCPNCHALSPNFRSLNKGKGRRCRE